MHLYLHGDTQETCAGKCKGEAAGEQCSDGIPGLGGLEVISKALVSKLHQLQGYISGLISTSPFQVLTKKYLLFCFQCSPEPNLHFFSPL